MKRNIMKNIYTYYTISFLLLLPLIFLPFLSERKSFVWNVDGINQHLPILLYYGKLLRGILTGNGFAMVDFHIGMGYDTISTLHYYVIGDPFALLSVFMNMENGVVIYNLLILFRLYLIGISFLLFCRYWRLADRGRVPGALIYVFCGYTFFSGVRHPYFLNPMIYLPLLLIGLEDGLRRKKPYLLIGMVFLSAVSNFYFFFVLTVISVIYVIVRYIVTFSRQESNKLLGFVMMGLRIGGNYLLGILLAAFIFLPVIYAFLQNGRMEHKPELLINYFNYNKDYYKAVLQGVFAPGVDPGYWVALCFPTLTAISFVILCCHRRYAKLRYNVILIILGLMVPVFGYFMNGFSYVANRWDFLLSFAVALIVTVTYEELFKLNQWEKVLLILGVTGYGVLTFSFPSEKTVKLTFLLLLATVLIVLLLQNRQQKNKKMLQQAFLTLLLFVSIGFNGYAFYSSEFNAYIKEFMGVKQIKQVLDGGQAALLKELRDDDIYRIETYGDKVRNEALVMDYHDVSAYYSLMDGGITSFYKQLELLNQRSAYRFDNQDNRTILDALACVKYFVTTEERAVPYGYRLINHKERKGKTYYLYENNYFLPIGYVYHEYLLEEQYGKLDSLEKQNALLAAVVLKNNSDYARVSEQNMSIGIEPLDYQLTAEGVILQGDKLKVSRDGAQLHFTFRSKNKSETYLQITDLDIDEKAIAMQTVKAQSEYEKYKKINVRSKYYNSYFGKKNYLVNLGYSEEEKTWITLTFPMREKFTYSNIMLYNVDMLQYEKRIEKLKQETLSNIKQSNNRIEGDTELNSNGIMLLSIPYSRGWKAYVDGQETELNRGNIMYMALPLSKGQHHILLRYRTPFLVEGSLLTALALMFLIIKLLYERKGGFHG